MPLRIWKPLAELIGKSTQPLGGRNQSLQKVERQNQQRNGTRHVLYVLMEVIESSMQLVCFYLCPDWLLGVALSLVKLPCLVSPL